MTDNQQPAPQSQDKLFRTRSPRIATWFVYSHRVDVPFLKYEAETREYIFWDSNQLNGKIIDDYNNGSPVVDIRKFHRAYESLLGEKIKLDQRLRKSKQASGI